MRSARSGRTGAGRAPRSWCCLPASLGRDGPRHRPRRCRAGHRRRPAGAVPRLALTVVADGLASPVDVADAGRRQRSPVRRRAGGPDPDRRRHGAAGPPVPRHRAEIKSGGEQGLLGLAFHPDFPTDPRFFVDYTDRQRQHGRLRVPRGPGGPEPRRPRLGAVAAPHRPAVSQPQRRRRSSSGRTGCCTSRWATAAPAAIRRATASEPTRCWPRSCASTWTTPAGAGRPYAIPRRQPVRRRGRRRHRRSG